MSDSLVTVIVAAYNCERFLSQALESVFSQDYDPFEVVFVDDGSTDGTAEIAQSFPVRCIHQENQGLPAARNAALRVARGEFVAFADDDDLLPPQLRAVAVGVGNQAKKEAQEAISGAFFRLDWSREGHEPRRDPRPGATPRGRTFQGTQG